MKSTALGVLASMLAASLVHAQDKPPRPEHPVTRATSSIQVDGVLDEQAWADAADIPLPYEWTPGDNTKPPVDTECLVTYDDHHLYIAFRAFDTDPSAIRAHLMDRDAINTLIQDDHVGVMIDTFNDERRAIQLRINPLGVQADATFSELEGGEDFSWDIIWDAAGKTTAEGYFIEISVPLNQLRFPKMQGPMTWGFEAFRSWPRSVRHRFRSYYGDRNSGCLLCQQGHLTGLTGLTPGLNVELAPTLTYNPSSSLDAFPDGEMQWRNETPDEEVFGITGRWGITSSTTLNATFNPDFSQVEADAAQLDVNTRFALFFPEKRPFFLEGSDFFSTPLQAVFTRTVSDPQWGTKLTGKLGPNAFGVVVAQDEQNNLLLPSNQGSGLATLDDEVLSSVVRYRRDVGSGSTVGALYTGREGDDYHNRLFGADTFIRLSPSDTIQAQFLRSDTLYPQDLTDDLGFADRSFQDNAFRVNYFRFKEKYTIYANYADIGRDFRADSGFMPRVDTRTAELELQRVFLRQNSWFTRLSFTGYGSRIEDQDGTLTDQTALLTVNYNGPLQSSVNFQAAQFKELVGDKRYTYYRQASTWSFQPTQSMSLTFFERIGETIDYANNQAARVIQFNPRAELKLGNHLNVQLDHTYQRLNVDGGRLFTANLSQARLVYQFNVRMFVRAILQYENVDREPEQYTFEVPEKSDSLFTQFLFSYKLNPQTVVFLGYSDDRFGENQIDLTQTNQSVFLKIGYAWVI